MAFGDLLSTAISILAIAALAGVGLQRGKVSNLRDSLKDAREEIADKDRRLSEAERLRELDATTIAKNTSDIAALTRVVTGETYLVALTHQLEDHHTQAMEGVGRIIATLERLERKGNP